MTPEERHVLVGDLDWLEYAIADYIAKWGEHWTGRPYIGEFGPNLAGMPAAVANMAMTVIRKNLDPLYEATPGRCVDGSLIHDFRGEPVCRCGFRGIEARP